jgi:hypothetical protein
MYQKINSFTCWLNGARGFDKTQQPNLLLFRFPIERVDIRNMRFDTFRPGASVGVNLLSRFKTRKNRPANRKSKMDFGRFSILTSKDEFGH